MDELAKRPLATPERIASSKNPREWQFTGDIFDYFLGTMGNGNLLRGDFIKIDQSMAIYGDL